MRTRGLRAAEPLVKHYRGDVYYVRCKAEGYGLYRIFYFRNGPSSFFAFHAFKKDTERIPGREKKRIAALYQQFRGKKL
ncbi:MAG: type II toxin-antitoxin system RelE/ParE family toxin [Gemmatimonadetes bacterium]|nr:type II toxin-antitoxin system RelE/ParE family toxin [Gemmatimonadota bacterium]